MNNEKQIAEKRRKLGNDEKGMDESSYNNAKLDQLTQIPIAVELVFRYLNAQQLRSCSQVCEVWKDTAEIVKRRRRDAHVFMVSAPKGTNGRLYDVVALIENFKEKLLSSHSERDVGILFFTNMSLADVLYVEHFLYAYDSSPPIFNYLSLNFHMMAHLIGLENAPAGLSSSRDKNSVVPEISAVFFPNNIPGVQFFPFKILVEPPEVPLSQEAIHLMTGIPKDTKIKCLLIFKMTFLVGKKTKSTVDPVRDIMNYYVKQRPLALGGMKVGFLNFINEAYCNPDEFGPLRMGCGLAFAGDNFEAASVLIAPDGLFQIAVTRRLMELKAKITLRSSSVAFLFSSRDENTRMPRNFEFNSFREIFPNVPLLGIRSRDKSSIMEFISANFFHDSTKVLLAPGFDTYMRYQNSVVLLLTWGSLPDGTCGSESD